MTYKAPYNGPGLREATLNSRRTTPWTTDAPAPIAGNLDSRRHTGHSHWRSGTASPDLTVLNSIAQRPGPVNGPYMPALTLSTRRPPPTVPQFDGTVLVGNPPAPASREVELRWRNGTVIDVTRSDPVTGYFAFKGWYTTFTDYEFLVRGDGFISRAYPTRPPRTLQWNGNPKMTDSYVPE